MADSVTEQPSGQVDDQGSHQEVTQPEQTPEVPDYLRGKVGSEQYAKWSDEQRSWAKDLYRDRQREWQETAELRRIKEDLDTNPEKLEHVQRAMTEWEARKAGLLTPSKDTAKSAKTRLDALMDGAAGEGRQTLQALIDALDERYGGKPTEEKLAKLEQALNTVLTSTHLSRRETLNRDVASLPAGLKELGEQYRESVFRLGVSNPALSAEKLVQMLSTPDEYRAALLKAMPEQVKKEAARARQTATAKPTHVVGTAETAEAFRQPPRDARFKKGSLNIAEMLRNVYDNTVKRGSGT